MITRTIIPAATRQFVGLLALATLWLLVPAQAQVPSDSTRTLAYRYYDGAVDPDLYLVRPQEKFVVSFVGTKLAPLSLTVNADGRLVDPSLGSFELAGKTLSEAKTILTPEIKKAYMADQIEITIGNPYQIAVALTGAVPRPGWYVGYTSNLVSELIDLAGGILPSGSRRHIIFAGGPQPVPVDLDRAMSLGAWDANPPLYAGNRIHVPQRSDQTVHVVGEVLRPREIELTEGDSVGSLLAMAGGVTIDGDREAIAFAGSLTEPITLATRPQPGQVIVVPPRATTAGAGTVFLFGSIAVPGRYSLAESSHLGDLLRVAGGVTAEGNRARTTIFRLAVDETTPEGSRARYPISITDRGDTFELKAGDSVFVPEKVGFVRIDGRVSNPGLVPWTEGKTVSHYVQLAGGYLQDADRQLIDLTDRVSRLSYRGGPDSMVGDGDRISVRRKEPGQ